MTRQWRPFPELKLSEIVQILGELGIGILESELSRPTPQHIRKIFERILELFKAVGRPSAESVSGDQAELYSDAFSLLVFCKNVRQFLENIGIHDFTLGDLVKPDPARIRMILSGMVNFAKFREEQISVFDEFSNHNEDLAAQNQHLKSIRATLTEQLKDLETARKANQVAASVRQEELKQLELELANLKKTKAKEASEVGALKTQRNELIDKISTSQFLVAKHKQECVKLKARYVENPQELIQTLETTKQAWGDEKDKLAKLEILVHKMERESEALESIDQHLCQFRKKIETCVGMIGQSREYKAEITYLEEQIMHQECQIKELDERQHQLERQADFTVAKLEQLNNMQSARRKTMNKALVQIQTQYNALVEQKADVDQKIYEIEASIQQMGHEIVTAKQHHEIEMNILADQYDKLRTRIHSYCLTMQKYATHSE